MSLENIQVYENFTSWATMSVTLTNAALVSLRSLLSVGDAARVSGRSIGRLVLHLAAGQTLGIASSPTDAEITITGPAAAGPDQQLALPLVNALDLLYVKGTGTLRFSVYFGS